MENVKCPHCGGKYCDLKKRDDSFDKTVRYYYCNGCRKEFTVSARKAAPSGQLLATLYTVTPRGMVQFYQESNGSIYYRQQAAHYNDLHDNYDPQAFSIHRTAPMLYISGIDLCMQSENAEITTIERIELNAALTAEAMKNEAMRTLHPSGSTFVFRGIRNTQLLKDACLWLRTALRATDFKTSKSGGCYIATCVYGSYDCPQVWTLRRFRDDTLARSWLGRSLIRAYYVVSPKLVAWFGCSRQIRHLWQSILDPMVKKLQARGIADTPYQDRPW